MSKKPYSTPVVKTEKIAFGVFGSYGLLGGGNGFSFSRKEKGLLKRFFRWF